MSEFFLSPFHSTGKLVKEPSRCFWNFLVFREVSGVVYMSSAKTLVNHRGGYHERCWKFFAYQKKNARGPFWCFWSSLLTKTGVHFSSKFFCLTVPKCFVGEHFCVSESLWYRKNLCIRGSVTIFAGQFFVLQYPSFRWRDLWCLRVLSINCTCML